MKLKIVLLLTAISLGAYTAYACSYRECGGGKKQCCIDVWNATYYTE